MQQWDVSRRDFQARLATRTTTANHGRSLRLVRQPQEGRIEDIFKHKDVYDKVIECRNNTVIWQGPGPFRDHFVEANPGCFTVLDATADAGAMSPWQEAKQNWINCHPNVPRRPGDPAPNGACDPNSFGDGQPKSGGCDAEVAEQASR